jgi:N-acetylglucosaminyldiphosphoundecaprenol N-acetyl-beta-D-mannosaminyltransferase
MPTNPIPESLPVLGIGVSQLGSCEEATEVIRRRIAAGRRTFCAAVNPAKIHAANRDPKLRGALEAAQLHICDGVGAALAVRVVHGRRMTRCTGIDLFRRLAAVAAREGWKVFLLGASPQSNAAARARLLEAHPSLKIVGSRDGFFKDSAEAVSEVNASGADLLFVAMGSPRQELWIAEQLPRLNPVFCMGVGGSFEDRGRPAEGRARAVPRRRHGVAVPRAAAAQPFSAAGDQLSLRRGRFEGRARRPRRRTSAFGALMSQIL